MWRITAACAALATLAVPVAAYAQAAQLGVLEGGTVSEPGGETIHDLSVPAGHTVYVRRETSDNVNGLSWSLRDSHRRVVATDPSRLDDLGPVRLMGGGYELVIRADPGQTGTYSFIVHDATPDPPAPVALTADTALLGTVSTPGQTRRVVFEAPAGTRLSIVNVNGGADPNLTVGLDDENGRVLLAPGGALKSVGPMGLAGGVYVLSVASRKGKTGAYDLRLVAFVDLESPLTLGEPAAGGLLHGQRHRHTFGVAPGARVFVEVAEGAPTALKLRLGDDLGRELLAWQTADSAGPLALLGGTYHLDLQAQGAAVPDYTVAVIPVEDTTSTATLGQAVQAELTTAGQTHEVALALAETTTLLVTRSEGPGAASASISIIDSVGRVVAEAAPQAEVAGPVRLPPGDFTVALRSDGAVGPVGITPRAVAPAEIVSAAPGGLVSGALEAPGDEDHILFDAAPGQALTVSVEATSSLADLGWRLEDSAGRVLIAHEQSMTGAGPISLVPGQHRLVVRAKGAATGTYQLALLVTPAPPAPVATPEASLGEVLDATVSPGAPASWALEVPALTQAYADLLLGGAGLRWSLRDPAGTAVFADEYAQSVHSHDRGPHPLVAGSYVLTVSTVGDEPVSFSARVVDAAPKVFTNDATASASGTLAAPGSVHRWDFVWPEDAHAHLHVVSGLEGAHLEDTFDQPVPSEGPLLAGSYRIVVDPEDDATGPYQVEVRSTSAPVVPLPLGVSTAGAIDGPGDAIRYQVTLDSDAELYLDLQDGAAGLEWSLRDSVGALVAGPTEAISAQLHDLGPLPLAAGGYELRVDAVGSATPAWELMASLVSVDAGPVQLGELLSGQLSPPGARVERSLQVPAAGARVFFDSHLQAKGAEWTARDAAGEPLFDGVALAGFADPGDRGPWQLAGGEYTLHLWAKGGAEPTWEVVAEPAPVVELAPLELGVVISGALAGPGAAATVPLEITDEDAGAPLVFDLLADHEGLRWRLVDPVGTPVFDDRPAEGSLTDDVGPVRLVAGTYVLWLTGEGDSTPGYELRVRPTVDVAELSKGCLTCDALEIVFLFDTSSSMQDDQEALCALADEISLGLQAQGVELTTRFLGITDTKFVACVAETAAGTLGTALPPTPPDGLEDLETCPPDDDDVLSTESWATGAALVAAAHPWQAGAVRLVVPLSDEGPACGDPLTSHDLAAVQYAAAIAVEAEVVISPIVSEDTADATLLLAEVLGEGTGGAGLRYSTEPEQLVQTVAFLAKQACTHAAELAQPTLVEVQPPPDVPLPTGTPLVLSGRVVDANDARPVVGIVVNGAPVQSVDGAGRFFATVELQPGENPIQIALAEGCGDFHTTLTLVGGGADAATDFAELVEASEDVSLGFSATTFDPGAERLHAYAALQAGKVAARGPVLAELLGGLPPTASLLGAAGTTPVGRPYVVVLPPGVTLAPQEAAPPVLLSFSNPTGVPLRPRFRLLVPANRPPYFVTAPPTRARAGATWTYPAGAMDPDGDDLAWELVAGPAGMQHDGGGALSWTPPAASAGTHHDVVLRVHDGHGGAAQQQLTLDVLPESANKPPIFLSSPPSQAAVGGSWTYAPQVIDPDGDPVGLTLVLAPSGMTALDNGALEWPVAGAGKHAITLRATDDHGGQAEQAWVLAVGVTADNPTGPLITSVPPTEATVGVLYGYQPVAHDPDGGPLQWSLDDGPDGMTMDGGGRMAWIPALGDAGDHAVAVRVEDGEGAAATQSFSLSVTSEPPNLAPWFGSPPPVVAVAGLPWTYLPAVTDPEGEAVQVGVAQGPPLMSVGADAVTLTWTPSAEDVGSTSVLLSATDPDGAVGLQGFVLEVWAANQPPVIAPGAPPELIASGELMAWKVVAIDPDGEAVVYSIETGPDSMTIDTSGRVFWAPHLEHVGLHDIVIRASDCCGGFDELAWTLEVWADQSPPIVEVWTQPAPPCAVLPWTLCVVASDDVGVVGVAVGVDDVAVPLGPDGCTGPLSHPEPGTAAVSAWAADPSGNVGTADLAMEIADCFDPEAPVVELHSPAAEAVLLAEPAPVRISVSDNQPENLSWSVTLAPADSDDFAALASGDGPIDDAVVASIDPTRLANGTYRLRVTAQDLWQATGVEVRVTVDGHYKPGRVQLELVDAVVEVAGIPLSVGRRYDTLDLAPHDFGPGWRLGLGAEVQDAAKEVDNGSPADLLATEAFTTGTRVTVTRPDGARVGFRFQPKPMSFPFIFWYDVHFEPEPGVEDTLTAPSDVSAVQVIGNRFYNLVLPYNPDEYVLTTLNGLQYRVSEQDGLLGVEDGLGNTVEVTTDGIFSSTGASVLFERDPGGRIQTVTLPGVAGALEYAYDPGIGVLISSSAPDGATTGYQYDAPGLPTHLTEVSPPSGDPLVVYLYDDDGRLIALCGGVGDASTLEGCTSFEYDLDGQLTTTWGTDGHRVDRVLDARGNEVLVRRWLSDLDYLDELRDYDDDDREVARTDPGGLEWTTEWDEQGRMTSRTDPAGRTWTAEYDSCPSPTRATDPDGNVTEYTFDASCRLTSRTDPTGHAVTIDYDGEGRITGRADGPGPGWTLQYSADTGQLTGYADPAGRSGTLELDTAGNLRVRVERDGRRIDYTYDSAQRLVSEVWDTEPPAVHEYTYDDAGRLLSASGPGSNVTISYDAAGRAAWVSTTGPTGEVVTLEYQRDSRGNVTSIADSWGGDTAYTYDALGRLTTAVQTGDGASLRADLAWDASSRWVSIIRSADVDGATPVLETSRGYDALQPVAIHHRRVADGAVVHDHDRVLDAAGRMLEASDAEGTHLPAHDGARRLLGVARPGGLQPDEWYAYDAHGDRIGSHLSGSYQYSALARELLADDQRTYTYDERGSLVAWLEQASGDETTLQTDHRGRVTRIEVRDSGGALVHEVTTVYDALDRRIAETVDGVSTRYAYDGRNPMLTLRAGEVTRRLYLRATDRVLGEAVGGEVYWLLPDFGGTIRDRVSGDGQVQEHYVYDAFGRLLSPPLPPGSERLLFQGRPQVGATGLLQLRHRLYAPWLGRFVQPDPLPPFRYGFAGNDPLHGSDPMGLMTFYDWWKATQMATDFASNAVNFLKPFQCMMNAGFNAYPTFLTPISPHVVNMSGGSAVVSNVISIERGLLGAMLGEVEACAHWINFVIAIPTK